MLSHRWLIPAFSITLITSYGSLFYAFAVLARPIQAELGWSADVTVGAYSLSLLIAGLSAYWIGNVIDRRGGRRLMTWGSALAGALLIALSQVKSLYLFYAVWAGLGIAMAVTQYEAAFAVVVAVFPNAYRNRIGLLTLAGGLSSTVFWPLTHWLVEAIGWRGAAFALGAFTLTACAPLHWYAVPEVAPHAHQPIDATPELPSHLTPGLRKILHQPAFWLITACFLAFAFVNASMALNVIPILESRGIDSLAAVSLAALVGPMQVTSRFTELLAAERLPALVLGSVTVLLIPFGIALLVPASASSLLIYAFVVFYGAGLGLITMTRATAVAEFFGRQRYGAVSGMISVPSAVSRALGPVTAAAVLTMSRSYSAVLWLLIGVAGLGAASYWCAVYAHRRTAKHLGERHVDA